jgi:hypothetical protein
MSSSPSANTHNLLLLATDTFDYVLPKSGSPKKVVGGKFPKGPAHDTATKSDKSGKSSKGGAGEEDVDYHSVLKMFEHK